MENQQQPGNLFGITINEVAKQELKTLSIWARITAIAAFVSYGIALVAAFVGKQYEGSEFAGASKVGGIFLLLSCWRLALH